MKKEHIETFAIISGLAAVATIVYYLITDIRICFIAYEPILWIRIPEIIMGMITIVVFGQMINRKAQKLAEEK